MALKKNERRVPSLEAPTLMGAQDATKGDSKATRTKIVSVSLPPDIAWAITEAAHDMRISRSEFVERACRRELRLFENRRARREETEE